MSKPADKLPTIEDLTRSELLRLIPMICPFDIPPIRIIDAQIDEAWDLYQQALPPLEANGREVVELAAKHAACVDRGAGTRATDKAWRAYLLAREGYRVTENRSERFYRRWERLVAQRLHLSIQDG